MLSSSELVETYMMSHFSGRADHEHGRKVQDLFKTAFKEIEERMARIAVHSHDDVSEIVDEVSQVWDGFRREIHRRLPPVSRGEGPIPSLEKLIEDKEPGFASNWLSSRLGQAS